MNQLLPPLPQCATVEQRSYLSSTPHRQALPRRHHPVDSSTRRRRAVADDRSGRRRTTESISGLVHNDDDDVIALHNQLVDSEEAYEQLQKDFQRALDLERQRFVALQRKHLDLAQQAKQLHDSYLATTDKEQKATSLLKQFTLLAQQQKVEIGRQREDAQALRGRNTLLERELADASHIRDENDASAEKSANLVQELAQERAESASLRSQLAEEKQSAADSKSQGGELVVLGGQLKEARELLELKERIIQSQKDSLEQLKHLLQGGLRKAGISSDHLLELERRKETQRRLEDELDYALQRKDQYKAQTCALEDELFSAKKALAISKVHWQEKAAIAQSLEATLADTRASSERRLTVAIAERDAAVRRADDAQSHLSQAQDEFAGRTKSERAALVREVETLLRSKDDALRRATNRVEAVEHEERLILAEMSNLQEELRSKRQLEEKLARLESALKDVRSDC